MQQAENDLPGKTRSAMEAGSFTKEADYELF
jgi:hypothetical protein